MKIGRRRALKAGLFGLVGGVSGFLMGKDVVGKEPEVRVVEEVTVHGLSPCQVVHGVPGFDPEGDCHNAACAQYKTRRLCDRCVHGSWRADEDVKGDRDEAN